MTRLHFCADSSEDKDFYRSRHQMLIEKKNLTWINPTLVCACIYHLLSPSVLDVKKMPAFLKDSGEHGVSVLVERS
jgi:hypothetical protein